MSLIKKISALSVVGLFALTVLAVPLSLAQDGADGGTGSGLQISPTRTEIGTTPGEVNKFTITLKNVTDNNITAQPVLNDFESDGESGTPKIIVDDTIEPTPYSIKDMIPTLKDVRLKGNETKVIEHTLEVPVGATPGAYFGALRYAAVPEGAGGDIVEGSQQVSLTASLAHLIFVEVPGDVVQQIQIESAVAQIDGSNASFYQKPTSSSVKVKNLGNGFSQPFGKVTIMRSGSEIYSYDINNTDPRGFVLPQSTRNFTDPIENISTPGQYKIVASVAYGNGGEVVSYESNFWYLPLWFLGIVALVVIALVAGGYYIYRRMANK